MEIKGVSSRILAVVVAVGGCWFTAPSRAAVSGPSITFLSQPSQAAEPFAMTPDGGKIVGGGPYNGTTRAQIWPGTPSATTIGVMSPYTWSAANDISDDGSVVVGRDWGSGGASEAFRWTSGGGIQLLGDLAGGAIQSEAFAISPDGSVIIGSATNSTGTQPFRWTSGTGMQMLTGANQPTNGSARDMSADAAVIIGWATQGSQFTTKPFRWTAASGFQMLANSGSANDITDDGNFIIGQADNQAFIWTAANGLAPLGFVNAAFPWSTAPAVSANGSLVVGQSQMAGGYDAFMWRQETGMVSLTNWAIGKGLDLQGYHLESARAISADGNIIVGRAFRAPSDGVTFMLVVPEPTSLAMMAVAGLAILGRYRAGSSR